MGETVLEQPEIHVIELVDLQDDRTIYLPTGRKHPFKRSVAIAPKAVFRELILRRKYRLFVCRRPFEKYALKDDNFRENQLLMGFSWLNQVIFSWLLICEH